LINTARKAEGLGDLKLELPHVSGTGNFYQYLSQDEKMVVLINLERQDRGLTPFPIQDQFPPAPYGNPALTWEAHNHAALLAEFYELAQGNNNDAQTTPLVHFNSIDGNEGDRITAIPGFTQDVGKVWPRGEAETNTQNAENAVYTWLYRDGPGWGHRHALLGVIPPNVNVGDPNTSDNCYTQIGAGFAASPNQAVYDQITTGSLKYVAEPEFFYVVDLIGQETQGWQLPTYSNTLTPSPLAATVVYNNPPTLYNTNTGVAPTSPPPGAPPPMQGMLSVYVGFQPFPFGSADGNIPLSVQVYPDPQWVTRCTQPGQFGLFACPTDQNKGTVGSTATVCSTPGLQGSLGTGWTVYRCDVPVPSTSSQTGLTVIVRDAYDQFVCLQPPFAQTAPLTDTVPILDGSTGMATSVMRTVTTDNCGVAPLQPFDPNHP
jgi:hypothetical protein